MLRRSVFSVLLLGLAAGAAHGQTSGMTSFQALVKHAAGDPITGTLNLEFRIYDAATAVTLGTFRKPAASGGKSTTVTRKYSQGARP